MYPRNQSLSQQQLRIPVLPDPATNFRESPALLFPGYRPGPNQGSQPPRFLQKTSSLPLQSPQPAPAIPSPKTYYYYAGGGSNRSSTIDSQTGLDNALNLSQDSGLSPSPLEQQHLYSGSGYDGYRKISATPEPQTRETSLKSGRWPFSDFFRRSRKDVVAEEPAPPLPPKKRSTNVFQPTMAVRPSHPNGVRAERPASVPGFGSARSWRHERETAMMRVEAQRNSLVLSSDDDEDTGQRILRRELVGPQVVTHLPRAQSESMQQQSFNRLSVSDLCHIPEMREPFPAELDFAQITKHSGYDPRIPPPPPPRDPRRKSFLLHGHSPQARPVSYSFENLPVQQMFRSPYPEPSDLGLPHPAVTSQPPLPRGIHKNFSTSEQQLLDRLSGAEPPSQFIGDPRFEAHQRSPRSVSLSNMNRSAAPYTNPNPVGNNLVSPGQGPESPLQLYKRSQLEYWKSPPPPFVPCPEPGYFADCLQTGGSPMQPKQRWRNQSAEDPILLLQGKSSPSSGSLTSRDSGCSEPFAASNAVVVVTPEQLTSVAPSALPVVVEKSESIENDIDCIDVDNDEEDSVVVALRRESLPPSSPCSSSSPVRSVSVDKPGFSCKKRRSLFRDAMCELEDALKVIQSDTDLLDRAERRDLPTAHQELIVRARIEEALGRRPAREFDDTTTTSLNTSAEMAFSDMDNFMNWNTSSSFENLEERALFQPATSTPVRQRTPSRRRSAIPDRKTDDVVYRICRSNNRPTPKSTNPAIIASQSYLLLSPEFAKALLLGVAQKPNGDEPDILTDDVHFRSIRDSRLQPKVLDRQPKFGIPNGLVAGCGSDYLHSTPSGKYKSTFNAMKSPDPFNDDLAVRNLRKDDSRNTPDLLGIYKDPNIVSNSCWRHKLEERLAKRPSSPLVFYPSKNNKLMTVLSQKIADAIRRQSGNPVGGSAEQVRMDSFILLILDLA